MNHNDFGQSMGMEVIDEVDTMPFGIAEGKQRIYYFSSRKSRD